VIKGYAVVIALAKSLIHNSYTGAIAPPTQSSFSYSFDLGVVGPLYFTATSCPDLSIRQEVIALLYESRRREGIWDGVLMAEVAERELAAANEGISNAGKARGGVLELARLHGLSGTGLTM